MLLRKARPAGEGELVGRRAAAAARGCGCGCGVRAGLWQMTVAPATCDKPRVQHIQFLHTQFLVSARCWAGFRFSEHRVRRRIDCALRRAILMRPLVTTWSLADRRSQCHSRTTCLSRKFSFIHATRRPQEALGAAMIFRHERHRRPMHAL